MVRVNFPLTGVISGWRTNQCAGPPVVKLKLLAHT
jgi:hypothetical protein